MELEGHWGVLGLGWVLLVKKGQRLALNERKYHTRVPFTREAERDRITSLR